MSYRFDRDRHKVVLVADLRQSQYNVVLFAELYYFSFSLKDLLYGISPSLIGY